MDCISAALFFMLLFMFALATIVKSDLSQTAQKYSGMPAARAAESFAADNFPIPGNWNVIYSATAIMMGQKTISGVFVDKDRLIDVITEKEAESYTDQTEIVNSFAQKYPDKTIYAMVVPTASGIYSADIPEFDPAVDQQKLIDDIYFALDGRIITLDAYNPLFSLRDEYVYFRTDSRWTSLGAFLVYGRVAPRMGLEPLNISNYDIEYADRSFYGDLYRKIRYGGVKADTINVFRNKYGSYVTGVAASADGQEFDSGSVYFRQALSQQDKYAYFLGGDYFEKVTVTTSNTSAPRLLIIKGDYANCLAPFLTPHYSEITLVDPARLDGRPLSEIADPTQYDQVMFLFDAEDFLRGEGFDGIAK